MENILNKTIISFLLFFISTHSHAKVASIKGVISIIEEPTITLVEAYTPDKKNPTPIEVSADCKWCPPVLYINDDTRIIDIKSNTHSAKFLKQGRDYEVESLGFSKKTLLINLIYLAQ